MKRAEVVMGETSAGILTEITPGRDYTFYYHEEYSGSPISLAIPVRKELYTFDRFPPFFDGLLPEGYQLEALLKTRKLDRSDYFGQLMAVGSDLVGAVSVRPLHD